MDQRSVFFEEWIRSLREQYKHVVCQDDRVTLPTLTAVMIDVGFSEDELAQLRVEATMHVDKLGSDHVADMEILEQTLPHAAECLCPVCTRINERPSDADDEPLPIDAAQETVGPGNVFSAAAPENIETSETNDEPAPLTFEDSLAAGETEASDDEDEDPVDSGDDDEDIDKPQQMSLF
ncbi:MAG: hypothetical protein OXG60_08580 [Chloroflexi bacterium]|nr:hypothetical protein [Chloroflexota bacterium]